MLFQKQSYIKRSQEKTASVDFKQLKEKVLKIFQTKRLSQYGQILGHPSWYIAVSRKQLRSKLPRINSTKLMNASLAILQYF